MNLGTGRRPRGFPKAAFVLAVMLLPIAITATSSAAVTRLQGPAAATTSPFHAADVALVNHYIDEISTKLKGMTLRPTVTVNESSAASGPDGADASTVCYGPAGDTDGGVPVTQCVIEVYMSARTSSSDTTDQSAKIHVALAHESFHLFQFQMAGSADNLDRLGDWLVEGSAAWVETDLVNDPVDYTSYWTKWLNAPTVPLFNRTYTAIGFFGHMASTGISPWSRFPAMFATAGPQAAYSAAVGNNQAFLDDWAAVYFRNPNWGTAWDQDNQNSGFADSNVSSKEAVGYTVPGVSANAVGKASLVLAAKPYAAGAWHVTLDSPITKITVVKGSVRIHSYGNNDVNEVVSGTVTFCSASNPAACSECNQPSTLLHMTEVGIAATGGRTGAEVEISTMKANTTPCQTTTPATKKQASCAPTPPPSIPYISTAELETIYHECVTRITIISGGVVSYLVDFTAPFGFGPGTTQVVTVSGSKENTSAFTPENGCHSGKVADVEITTYVIEKDGAGATASSRNIGGCADDGEVASIVYGAVKARA